MGGIASRVIKTKSPGSVSGMAGYSPISAVVTKPNSYTSGSRIPKAGKTTTPAAGKIVKSTGSCKVAQGGENGCDAGVSRASRGRNRL